MHFHSARIALATVLFAATFARGETFKSDVVVFGATSGGVVAAVQAARLGKTVQLVEPSSHVGGMTSGGLGWIDFGRKESIGGMSHEFFAAIHNVYKDLKPSESLQGVGWSVEPHVAERIYLDMLAGAHIATHLHGRLAAVKMDGKRIVEITTEAGDTYQARVFIDATYEGDLMAGAHVSFTTTRESTQQYGEPLAGFCISTPKGMTEQLKIDPYLTPGDPASGLIALVQDAKVQPPGSPAVALQCYNYRLCLTRDASNRLPIDPPENYDPKRFELVARYLAAMAALGEKVSLGNTAGSGHVFLKISRLPHGKTDVNQAFWLGTDYVGYSTDYPNASYAQRDAIAKDHESYTRGLLHFLATDERVPEEIRREMNQWGLCKDEFPDTKGWPYQLYVREARRMVGSYVMTQNDCEAKTDISDSVGLGSYSMDSHCCQRIADHGTVVQEGQFYSRIGKAYPISYRAIVPKATECDNLLVPACCSASHVAYASVRMEPVFMILGQSAATAAVMAVDGNLAVQNVNYAKLATELDHQGQILKVKAK